MISICCCAVNAKWDVKSLVDLFCRNNQDVDFEIVLTHDERVMDGAEGVYIELQEKYPGKFRYIKNTDADTIAYLEWCVDIICKRQRFHPDFRAHLKENLEKYKSGDMFDKKKNFLWTSTGILYNKAILASKGDILHVSGADFLFPLKLKDLETYVNKHKSKDGRFYAKPTAVFAAVTNAPKDYIIETTKTLHEQLEQGKIDGNLKASLHRDYLYYPSELSDIYVCDFNKNEVISLGFEGFQDKIIQFFKKRETEKPPYLERVMPMFHGVHVMTRKSWEIIGGFTEEWYGRAFAEDKMTQVGICTHTDTGVHPQLPPEFSFLWPGQGDYLPVISPYYPPNHEEVLKQKDPYFGKHPIPGTVKPIYLHDGYKRDQQYLHDLPKILSHYIGEPTIRFTNGDSR